MILFPSNTNDTHFGGFSVRSRSGQALEISFKASAWSAGEDKTIVRSSANPLTLCGLEQLAGEPPTTVSFVGRNHLSVPRAGFHFRSVTSVKFPLRYLRQVNPLLSIEMTFARYHPVGSLEFGSSQRA